jgi:quinoprotein glucose dehydrogenase
MLFRLFLVTAIVSMPVALAATPQQTYKPKIYGPSEEGLKTLKRMKIPKGTVATLAAAEPNMANPVAFAFDEQGRLFVAETFRLHFGVTDNRNHNRKKGWLESDLACRTVNDRLAMYKKFLGKDFPSYEKEHDRVRLLTDSKGTGVFDESVVFADGFNSAVTGIGAGVLARGSKVWYTCIPDLWLLEENKETHQAGGKKLLSTGYGIHTSFLGHDSHGLKIGPDGRLYFSIGDRGFRVALADGRVLDNPDSGAVLRCNLDGTGLEVVHYGLRNPQELAFDQYGNLFTGDNNADGGDRARWVHIVPGGDSGWRIGWQYMNKPTRLGPWNAEKMWELPFADQAAHLLPPCAHVASGPAGLTYNPGVSQLPERYKDHFFLVDFHGNSGGSGILSFKIKPRGASFQLDGKTEQFVWSILATDCDFGPNGGFYLSDWVDGWNTTGKGRLYMIGDPDRASAADVLEVKKLIAEGMANRTTEELAKLLGHADMRVRQEAQFELVERKDEKTLATACTSGPKLTQLHGIWGLGMLVRRGGSVRCADAISKLIQAEDVDVCSQALKTLGDAKVDAVLPLALEKLKSPHARVRFEAAMAVALVGKPSAPKSSSAAAAVLEMLRENSDKDAYLRHAGVMALMALDGGKIIDAASKDSSAAVRLAALLAMRRLQSASGISRFLDDADPRLVLEAARAIVDQPIPEALPRLAALSGRTGLAQPLVRRIINANFRLGSPDNALALAKMASRSDLESTDRLEALACLGDWENPSPLDRTTGLSRPLASRPAGDAARAVRANLGGIFSGPNSVRQEAAKLAGKYGIKEVGPVLLEIAVDTTKPAGVRVETLKALAALKDARLEEAMDKALKDSNALVRTAGRRILASVHPEKLVEELKAALEAGDATDRQGALAILAEQKQDQAAPLLEPWLDKLLAGKVQPEIHLDLLEAAAKIQTPAIAKKLAEHEATRSPKDHLSKWTESLYGGDVENGRRIFFERSDLSCLRCHKVQGTGGDVGPDLTGIGTKQKREYLLESIVEPDRQIAKGYETVVLTLVDGKVKTGILKSEDKTAVSLMTPEGTIVVVPVAEIDTRTRGPSAMPGDLMKNLSRRDLRDLVEFLAGLK